MTDKLSNKDLQGVFTNRTVTFGSPPEDAQSDAESYNKYGIYCDPSGRAEFLRVIMVHDDTSITPKDQLTEDDYLQHSVQRYDFAAQQWVGGQGLMKLISSASFSFMAEDAFFDQFQKHKRHLCEQTDTAPEESQP